MLVLEVAVLVLAIEEVISKNHVGDDDDDHVTECAPSCFGQNELYDASYES